MAEKETPESPAPPTHQCAAFVLGVTGNMDPVGYGDRPTPPKNPAPEIAALRQTVFGILDWLRQGGEEGCLRRESWTFGAKLGADDQIEPPNECWQPLVVCIGQNV